MEKILLLYPTVLMMILTFFLYVKNYFDNRRSIKEKNIDFNYFKTYNGEVPEYVAISRQTLKNQFELPIFFYFLISVILIFDNTSHLDIALAWIFVSSRYLHCYIRLSSNYVPYRAITFQIGMFTLIIWWIIFLYHVL